MTEYITGNTCFPPYMVFPKFLLDINVNETAKLLYVILLDRARLSMQNEGWADEYNRIYIIYTIKNMAATLRKSEITIKTALNALTEEGLIMRMRQGSGNPNWIYVKIPKQKERILTPVGIENLPIEGQNTDSQGVRKLSTNNKESIKNNHQKQRSKEKHKLGKYQNVYLTEDELRELHEEIPASDDYIERLSAYMESVGKSYKNHAATIRSWATKDKESTAPMKRVYECAEGDSL
ncbi:replication initiator protein A [Enterocloster aldenensis]|uniref:replication initiator protein A n=1 Tax=Enterocloster aldenensis TaxID=358742 RepID=UPI000E418647|nr:replication initiator protein A [Enterocloster aldenensis]